MRRTITLFLALTAGIPACGEPAPKPTADVLPTPDYVRAGGLPAETAIDDSTRTTVPLSGPDSSAWHFRFDASDVGVDEGWYELETLDASWTLVEVPAAWDLAHPDGFDRQTVGWYLHRFPTPSASGAVRLRFDGVFREAQVWLNGENLGSTDLPYLPFAFDVTDHLIPGEENLLAVRVDNRLTDTSLPCDTVFNPGRHGWFPYGGILRPVWLEIGLETWTAQVLIRTGLDGAFEADVHFGHHGAGVPGAVLRAEVTYGGDPVTSWGPSAVPDPGNGLRLSTRIEAPLLFSPDHPEHVYTLRLTLEWPPEDPYLSAETTSYDFAFRRLEAADGRFLYNGEDFYLRGINRHEDHPTLGPVYDEELLATDMALIAELGANFSRPGHYPNDVRVLRAFETQGVLLAEEIPVYQWDHTQLGDPEMTDRAARALEATILRDYNRPAIVMWSVANEIHSWAQTAPGFVQTLYDTAKALDPDRPVMVAAVSVPLMSEMDESSGLVDVVGINEYEGWYVNTTDNVTYWLETLHAIYPDRTLFVSEYGAGALLGRHVTGTVGEEPLDDHSYSEEFQAYFHEQHIEQFLALDFVRGFMPWVFADFRMQWTPTTGNPHPVERMNLKGLVSDDRQKKAAFDTIANAFSAAQ